MSDVVLLTDHSSAEGSGAALAEAVERLTGEPPIAIDARHFMTGGSGRAWLEGGRLTLGVRSEDLIVRPAVVLIYEIPPAERRRFEAFQRRLRACGAISLGTDADAWRSATEKNLTVEVLRRARVPQMETIHLSDPTTGDAAGACARLGGDVWARPTVGAGGHDVFHVATAEQLAAARTRYATHGQDWLLARDALNFNGDGRRHQYRVVVLGERVLRVCEHIQDDADAPCNEGQGAVSTLLAVDDLAVDVRRIAVSATHALGLPFGGVDLATTGGGIVVFEVNVHPVICPPRGLEDVAVPYVQAHLALLPERRWDDGRRLGGRDRPITA
jgi:glutathione synthase/RimK-type ligase-like ATP-grasp enzyme